LLGTTVYDAGGNNNGRLDPGETVGLTSTLRNTGAVDFTDLSTTIECSDPYITITDHAGYFGSLAVDSIKENIVDPYVVSADPSTPTGHITEFNLIADDGGYVDTLTFKLTVGNYHYLVWNPDPTPVPGQRIDSILDSILCSLGYTGEYSTDLLGRDDLDLYYAIFVCVGIFANNYVIGESSSEATALENYLNNGGNMYLEGGDIWYYDPPYQGGYDFGPLFGIQAVSDGTGDLGPVVGESGTFTDQMNFNYTGENSYIDHINPTGSGFLIFRDGNNNYNCGVANDAGIYKTVGSSFELGGLVDGSGVSTKAVLLDSIMHFFGIFSTGIDEVSDVNVKAPILRLYPNPFSKLTTISFGEVYGAKSIDLKIYDATGKLVKDFSRFTPDASRSTFLFWDGRDNLNRTVPNGIYFVRLVSGENKQVVKVILVK
jgi:hypothetical protein